MTAQSRDGNSKNSCNSGRRAKALMLTCGKITACKCSHYGKQFDDSSLRQTQIYHVTQEFYYEVIYQKELKTGSLTHACSQIVIASLLTVPNVKNNSGSRNRQIVVYAYKGKHQSLHVVCPQSDLEGFIL